MRTADARARAQVLHFATLGALRRLKGKCTDVLQLAEPAVVHFLRSLGYAPICMIDMLLRAYEWNSGATAGPRDREHLRAIARAARDATFYYLLGWGCDVRARARPRARVLAPRNGPRGPSLMSLSRARARRWRARWRI